jgi:4-carboxymuconolactone decarboxylase
LNADGQTMWDSLVASRGPGVVGSDNALVGAFNVWSHAPAAGLHLALLGAFLRYGTSLGARLTELAIITVAARWRADFEWWAHSRLALEAGVTERCVVAIGAGEAPSFVDDSDTIVFAVAHELTRTGTLGDELYHQALACIGVQAMAELVSICGYYTLLAFQLNAFACPLPPGATTPWQGCTNSPADR